MNRIAIETIVFEFFTQQLEFTLSADVPDGYETANAAFDIVNNTLFFNRTLLNSAPDFTEHGWIADWMDQNNS